MQQKVAELGSILKPEVFLDKVPAVDATGAQVPDWKRLMMARKLADKAKKEAEQQLLQEQEAKRKQEIPEWKRNILNRRTQHPEPSSSSARY